MTLLILISCKQENQKNKSEVRNLRQITSIAELKLQEKNIISDTSKYEYYFCLYRLNEVLKFKENKRLSEINVSKLLEIVDSVYDFKLNDKDFSKVKTFDSLNKVDKNQLFDVLKSEFYFGDGVELEQVNTEGNFYDKNDERNINPNFYTFRNSRINIQSLEFYYYKVGDSLILLNFSDIKQNVELLAKRITKIIDNKTDSNESYVYVRTNYLNSIIKQKDNFYLLTFNVEHESGKEVKYEKNGELQFLIDSNYKIVPNSIKFMEEKNKKLHNL